MKKIAKRIAALAMTAAMMTASAGAITQDGQSETWFDGVWALIDAFGLKAEHDPYVLQNYINKYLEKHPDEMYDVLNDILSLLDTHSMYLSSEEYTQGFSTLEGFVGIGGGLQETENGVQIAEVMRYSAAEEAGLQIGDLIVKINGEDATGLKNADVASKLRGEEGTSVKLTVRRYGRDITVTCERRQVNRVYVSNKTMADGVEYIKVSAIGSQNDWSAFSEIWDSLPSKNTRAVILDLRGNGGGLLDQLEAFLAHHPETRLMIVDTLQKIREIGSDKYNYANDYEIVGRLKAFSDRHNLCLLIVPHTRKMESEDSFDMISGTNGLLGAADGAFILQKKKRTATNAVLSVVGRDQQDQELLLQFDHEKCVWKLIKAETEVWRTPPDPVLLSVSKLITPLSPEWCGTPSELHAQLADVPLLNHVLTRHLNANADLLYNDYGILYENRRTCNGRIVTLKLKL